MKSELWTAPVAAMLLTGCTLADLRDYQNRAEEVTIDAIALSAAQAQMQRLESEKLRWELMKRAADQLLDSGHPLLAVQILDCYYYSRQPLYLTRVLEWLATINGEVDGKPHPRPWPAKARPWECEMPEIPNS